MFDVGNAYISAPTNSLVVFVGGEWDEGYDYSRIILSHPFQMAGRDAKQRREMYKKKQREKFVTLRWLKEIYNLN